MSMSYCVMKERKMVNFELGETDVKIKKNQHVTSMGQRKNLSPRQDLNLRPQKPVGNCPRHLIG